jgi:hypothetical protein
MLIHWSPSPDCPVLPNRPMSVNATGLPAPSLNVIVGVLPFSS